MRGSQVMRGGARDLLLAMLCTVQLTGCALLPRNNHNIERAPELGRKRVIDKVEPSYLIAVDRSECTVSREKFAQVKIGDNVWCLWQPPRGVGGTISRGP